MPYSLNFSMNVLREYNCTSGNKILVKHDLHSFTYFVFTANSIKYEFKYKLFLLQLWVWPCNKKSDKSVTWKYGHGVMSEWEVNFNTCNTAKTQKHSKELKLVIYFYQYLISSKLIPVIFLFKKHNFKKNNIILGAERKKKSQLVFLSK